MNYQTTGLPTVLGWVGRLLRGDVLVFDEIRQDRSATVWALAVVVVASLASGFGAWLWWFQRDFGVGNEGDVFIRAFLLGGLFQAAVWVLWVYLVFQMLARAFDADTDFYELIRTMGLAFLPMTLCVLMVITALAIPIGILAVVATVLLSNLAIESTTSATTNRIMIANLSGFAAFALIMGILANIGQVAGIGGIAPGIFFFTLD